MKFFNIINANVYSNKPYQINNPMQILPDMGHSLVISKLDEYETRFLFYLIRKLKRSCDKCFILNANFLPFRARDNTL